MTINSWLVLTAIALIVAAAWFVASSRPLSPQEIQHLAIGRRQAAITAAFGLSHFPRVLDAEWTHYKRGMATTGRFDSMDWPLSTFPGLAAGLLKGKHHEWVLVGVACDSRVVAMWMNKGPNNSQVTLFPSWKTIHAFTEGLKATAVMRFHNHPNGVPFPSPTDLFSGDHAGRLMVGSGIAYFDFVACRGVPSQFGYWVPREQLPISGYLSQVEGANGRSRLANLRLRNELNGESRPRWRLAGASPARIDYFRSHNLDIADPPMRDVPAEVGAN